MRIVRGLASYPPDAPPTVVALGVFDGVHLGHRATLDLARDRARHSGLTALACTFDPHPMEVLQPGRSPSPIATLEERLELIGAVGIDGVVVLEFTRELATVEPDAFVKDVLLGRLRAREVVVGFNHTFGRGARGNSRLLKQLSGELGFTAHVVDPLMVDGVAVSSSAVRAALATGDVERAARYLGRPYTITGRVVRGAGRGQTLGFPTANVEPGRPPLVAPGVYACWAQAASQPNPAVVNIGVRPTFGEGVLVVEAHLLDFEGQLYDQPLRLAFVGRLREERRFPGSEALREQIARDVAAARDRLGSERFTSGGTNATL